MLPAPLVLEACKRVLKRSLPVKLVSRLRRARYWKTTLVLSVLAEIPRALPVAYIQQVFWAKKYLPRKSEGFRDHILNSKFFIKN